MTPKAQKPDPKAAASWITKGRAELQAQTPAQRGFKEPVAETPAKPAKAKRERFTVNLSPDLIEWARRAVVFTPGQSLTGLMEEALTRELERLEKKQGAPYPETTATPKKGRPVTLKNG
jgi:hypothetical protein